MGFKQPDSPSSCKSLYTSRFPHVVTGLLGTSLFVNSSKALKIAVSFTLRESRGHRISFVVKGSQQTTTVSFLTPLICSTLDFCNVRV